jgi:hypothetical protein
MDYKELLGAFYYPEESVTTIADYCNGVRTESNCNMWHIDDMLQLGPDHRRVLSTCQAKEDTFSYDSYIEFLNNNIGNMRAAFCGGNGELDYDKYIVAEKLYTQVVNYETYKSGRTPDGQKLFKALLKVNLLRKSEIDLINKYRKPATMLNLVISRNLIDFIMCSTGQQFTSCMSLESARGYYFGIPGMLLNKHYAIVYITTGTTHEYKLEKADNSYSDLLTYYKYVERSFVLVDNNGQIRVLKSYPADASIASALNAIDCNVYDSEYCFTKDEGDYDTFTKPLIATSSDNTTFWFADVYHDNIVEYYDCEAGCFTYEKQDISRYGRTIQPSVPFSDFLNISKLIDWYKESYNEILADEAKYSDSSLNQKSRQLLKSYTETLNNVIAEFPEISNTKGEIRVRPKQVILDEYIYAEIYRIISGSCPRRRTYCSLTIHLRNDVNPMGEQTLNVSRSLRNCCENRCRHYEELADEGLTYYDECECYGVPCHAWIG